MGNRTYRAGIVGLGFIGGADQVSGDALGQRVSDLDGDADFPYDAKEAARTLEAIVGFHISHDRAAAWVDLPLAGADREREVLSG